MIQYSITKEELDWLDALSILLKSKKYKKLIQKIRSRKCNLAVEQELHWRDLFVSDLRSLIDWDARNGNPELFKAIAILDKQYNIFSVKRHDKQVQEKVLNEAIDRLTFCNGAGVDEKGQPLILLREALITLDIFRHELQQRERGDE